MYNKLFDVLYSFEVSEDVKSLIVESLQTQLNEDVQEISTYVQYINTLIDTNIASEALDEVITMTFDSLSEAEIEKVTEEFIKSSVYSYILEARFATPRPIGLTGLNKVNKAKETEVTEPKKTGSSAMNKLKSAVGKVKSFVDKVREVNKPSTIAKINRLQAEQDARVKSSAELGTSPKASDTVKSSQDYKTQAHSTAQATPTPTTTDTSIDDRIKKHNERVNKQSSTTPRPSSDSPIMMGYQKEKKRISDEEIQKRIDKHNQRANNIPSESPSIDSSKPILMGQKKEEVKVEEPKTEETKTTKTTKTTKGKTTKGKTTKSGKKNLTSVSKRVAKAVRDAEEVKTANEALESLGSLFAYTTISETLVEEISEMISNKKAAKKAVAKEEQAFNNAVNNLNRAVVLSSKTGIPVDPELAKKAEEQGERYEHFKALADKKFGS